MIDNAELAWGREVAMRWMGLSVVSLLVAAAACSSAEPAAPANDSEAERHVAELERQLESAISERDALLATLQAAADRHDKAEATQDALYQVIQNPMAYGSEEEVLDLLDTFAAADARTGDMAWGDTLGPWWREGWKNTLFGGANATIKTWDYWLSDDGSLGGSLWTWSGTARNGQAFEIQGAELSRFDESGLYREVVMFYPYEDEEVHRRFDEGNTVSIGTPDSPKVAPLTAIPHNLVVVVGTATCDVLTDEGTASDGAPGTPIYLCELDMSDPRVSGTQRDDRFRIIEGGPAGFAWVYEESVITNEEGTWRGTIQAADDSAPCGEAHYVGEDAYDGLEFHYYFCDVRDAPVFRGWIAEGG